MTRTGAPQVPNGGTKDGMKKKWTRRICQGKRIIWTALFYLLGFSYTWFRIEKKDKLWRTNLTLLNLTNHLFSIAYHVLASQFDDLNSTHVHRVVTHLQSKERIFRTTRQSWSMALAALGWLKWKKKNRQDLGGRSREQSYNKCGTKTRGNCVGSCAPPYGTWILLVTWFS